MELFVLHRTDSSRPNFFERKEVDDPATIERSSSGGESADSFTFLTIGRSSHSGKRDLNMCAHLSDTEFKVLAVDYINAQLLWPHKVRATHITKVLTHALV